MLCIARGFLFQASKISETCRQNILRIEREAESSCRNHFQYAGVLVLHRSPANAAFMVNEEMRVTEAAWVMHLMI
jgi:hypothetical protein